MSKKTGNYLVYFPSFQYLNEVYMRFYALQQDMKAIRQLPYMNDHARKAFLDEFSTFGERTLVGFAVMGGIFGEGIDLTGERLSGVVIVGVGLPQLCLERNIIKQYFDEYYNGSGFHYSYTFPGLNRVLQAAGRVIRTENDRGIVVLVDDRFSSQLYTELFPPEWQPVIKQRDMVSLSEAIREFWDG